MGKGKLQKLFVACAKDETAANRRDALLIAVLYGGGLRRSEVVALDLAELRFRHGKGQKGRVSSTTCGSSLTLALSTSSKGVADS